MNNIEIINELIDKLIKSDITLEELYQLENFYKEEKYKDYISSQIAVVGSVKAIFDSEFKKKLNLYHNHLQNKSNIIPMVVKITSIAAIFFLITFIIINRKDNSIKEIVNAPSKSQPSEPKETKSITSYENQKTIRKTNQPTNSNEHSVEIIKTLPKNKLSSTAPTQSGKHSKLLIKYGKSRNNKTYYKFDGKELDIYSPGGKKLPIKNLQIKKGKYYLKIDEKLIKIVKTKYKKELKFLI